MLPCRFLTAVVAAAALQAPLEAAGDVPVTFSVPGAHGRILATVHDASVFHARHVSDTPPACRHRGRVGEPENPVVINCRPGADVVVRLTRADGCYYLDGPFRWPEEPQTRTVLGLRRTVAGRSPPNIPGGTLQWLDEDGVDPGETWPRCHAAAGRWACVGVPVQSGGVVVFSASAPVTWAVVAASGAEPRSGEAAWATLLVLESSAPGALEARVRLLSAGPGQSARPTRLLLRQAREAQVEAVSSRAFLLSGTSADPELVLQVDGPTIGLSRMAIRPESVSLWTPLRVTVQELLRVDGRVLDSDGRAAGASLLHIAEVVEFREANGRVATVRRPVGDFESDDEGAFTVTGLGPGRYEALALHATHGRGTVAFRAEDGRVTIRLAAAPRVTGRVVKGGLPVAAVRIDVPPDHESYRTADDPLDVLAAGTMTGAEGRFEIALPPRGGSELRVEHAGVVSRIPLPPVSGDTRLELGDISLTPPIVVRVAFIGHERCGLVAAGPLGRSGLTMIEAAVVRPGVRTLVLPEPGMWTIGARCDGRDTPVSPPMLEVPAQVVEWSAHVTVGSP